ncbi:MAG TPA: T9SS type A sorting domain-containing protein, partial [Saprospiraceae bacterium]|nr:T9SS type A sorting domain-containing protein [Saprospiraceae bacterium]
MDPFLSFSLWFDSEACCDEAWVERSIDGGQTWAKVGTSGTGQNWYNDDGNQWWDGTGGFTGWVTAYNTLTGVAGQSNVRIRFVFSSDGSIQGEGIGVDDINIDATPTALVEPIDRLTGISLAPNPTGGVSILSVSFAEPVDAIISIHDMLGRQVSVIKDQRVSNGAYPIDLSNQPAGIYLVRVMVDGKVNTLKLVRGQ